jgi:phosphoglycolate phosphatase
MIGEGLTRLIEKALGSVGKADPATVDEAAGRFIDHYRDHLSEYSRPYPYARDELERLHDVKLAVLSNKKEELSRRLLEELDLLGCFHLVAGSDTTPEKKPSPRAVEYVMEALGEPAERTVLVGDSDYDVRAGRAAGVTTVAVTYGYRPRRALASADHVIDSLSELVPLFRELDYLENRRSETRYSVPEVARKYVRLLIRTEGGDTPALLLGISEHGLKFQCARRLVPGSSLQCAVSLPDSLPREVELAIRVKYTVDEGETHVSGAAIEHVESEMWFKVFRQTLKFIRDRHGEMF